MWKCLFDCSCQWWFRQLPPTLDTGVSASAFLLPTSFASSASTAAATAATTATSSAIFPRTPARRCSLGAGPPSPGDESQPALELGSDDTWCRWILLIAQLADPGNQSPGCAIADESAGGDQQRRQCAHVGDPSAADVQSQFLARGQPQRWRGQLLFGTDSLQRRRRLFLSFWTRQSPAKEKNEKIAQSRTRWMRFRQKEKPWR